MPDLVWAVETDKDPKPLSRVTLDGLGGVWRFMFQSLPDFSGRGGEGVEASIHDGPLWTYASAHVPALNSKDCR